MAHTRNPAEIAILIPASKQRAIEEYLLKHSEADARIEPKRQLKNARPRSRGGTITMLRISHFVTKSVASAAAKALPASAPRRVKAKYANEILLDMTSALHEVQRVENWTMLGPSRLSRVRDAGGPAPDAARSPPVFDVLTTVEQAKPVENDQQRRADIRCDGAPERRQAQP